MTLAIRAHQFKHRRPCALGALLAATALVALPALAQEEKILNIYHWSAIPADAPQPNNALLWMNYIMRPEVHASLSNKVFHANPNAAATRFVRKDIAENKTIYLSDDDKNKMIVPEPASSDLRRTMTRVYTRFKTGL